MKVVFERVAALALGLVVVLLSWILLAAYLPGAARLASEEVEVVVVLVALVVALGTVSALALVHSRPRQDEAH